MKKILALAFVAIFTVCVFSAAADKRIGEMKVNGRTIYFDARKTPCSIDEIPFSEQAQRRLGRNYPNYSDAIKAAKESGLLNGRKIIPSFGIIHAKIDDFDKTWIVAYFKLLRDGLDEEFWGEQKWFRTLINTIIKNKEKFLPKWKKEYDNTLILLGACSHSIDTRGLPKNFPAELRDRVIKRSKTIDAQSGISGILLNLRNDHDTAITLLIGLTISENKRLKRKYERLITLYTRIGGITSSMNVLDILPYFSGKNNRKRYFSGKQNTFTFRTILEDNDNKYAKMLDKKAKDGSLVPIEFRLLPMNKSFVQWTSDFPGAQPTRKNPNFMDTLILGLQHGTLSFLPNADAGYYSHKMYAVESMVQVGNEAEVVFSSWYRWRQIRNFESFIPIGREMTIRARRPNKPPDQAENQVFVTLKPQIRVEPLPTYFLRSARSYTYILRYLKQQIHSKNLKNVQIGKDKALLNELEQMKLWCYGLYFVSIEDVGSTGEIKEQELSKEDQRKAKQVALKWIRNFEDDPVLKKDLRKLVPSPLTKAPPESTSFWACAGVTFYDLSIEFYKKPKILALDDKPVPNVRFVYQKSNYIIPAKEFFAFSRPDNLEKINKATFIKLSRKNKFTNTLKKVLQGQPKQPEQDNQ